MDKFKLCLVIPSLQAGGMERVMSELAWYFSRKPLIDIHLILYGKTQEIFYSIPDNLTIHKPNFRFKDKWRFFYTFKTILFLRKRIKTIRPESILSFGEYWNNFVILSTLGIKTMVYVSDRSQPDKKLKFPHQILRKILYRRAAGIIAQTETARKIYAGFYNHSNIGVIGNPIKNISHKNTQPRENIVLSVGRLIETKHYDELIRMFAHIAMPDWKLVIVGGDSLKQKNKHKLESLINSLDLESTIEITGKRTDVQEFYSKSKIFAFTSSSEGFPNVIGEAMATGLPVVAWDCIAGPSELVEDGSNGYLVPLFEKKQFEVKLKELMLDERLIIKFGENAIRKAEEYNVEIIGSRYYDFIMKRLI